MKVPVIIVLLSILTQYHVAFGQDQPLIKSPNDRLQQIMDDKVTGVFLFNPQIDLDSFFSFCRKTQVNMVFSNEAFYRNEAFLQKAASENVNICLNFPVFFDQEYLESHPDHYAIDSQGKKAVRNWLHFACPSVPEFMAYQEDKLRTLIELTDPAMVSLDFIRFFVFWEMVYPETRLSEIVDGCYCDRCINNFQRFSGLQVPDSRADWIRKNARSEWSAWKCQVIKEKVGSLSAIIREYKIPVALKLVPWMANEYEGAIRSVAGQDIDLLRDDVDLFIPMSYSHMLKREPRWINEIAAYVHSATNKPVLTCVEVENTYVEEKISAEELDAMIRYAQDQPSAGVVLFFYSYIKARGEELVGDLLKE